MENPFKNRNVKENLILGGIIALLMWLILSIVSCSPSKRLQRIIEKNPNLAQKDTLIYRDTINHVYNGVYRDTILHINNTRRDTVIIRDKHLTVRTFVHKDSIFVSGECDTLRDTTIIEKHIPYEKFVFRKPRDGLIQSWGWPTAIIVVSIVALAIFIIKKFFS